MGTGMLEPTRPMMIVAALYARRPSLTAQREWCAAVDTPVDNQQISPSSTIAFLLDSLAQIPELYAEHDTVSLGVPPSPHNVSDSDVNISTVSTRV